MPALIPDPAATQSTMSTDQTTVQQQKSQVETPPEQKTLGILLRSVLAYSDSCLHKEHDGDTQVSTSRDFSQEARIIHDILLRCCQILHTFSMRPDAVSSANHGENSDVHSHYKNAESSDDVLTLWEILKDATTLIEAMIGAAPVNLPAWTSFNNILLRETDGSAMANRVMSSVRPGANRLHPRLEALADPDANYQLDALLRAVFTTLAQQLEYLAFIETSMKDRRSLKSLMAVLALIHADTTELLERLQKQTSKATDDTNAVMEALDGTAYAVGMELKKAFEYELAGIIEERQPHYVYAKLENAHGLLRDCFQQSIVALAQIIDPELQGTHLFSNFQTKLDQSISLRNELWRLMRSIRRSVETRGEMSQSTTILEPINSFRDTSLRFLMYKDRESFERFCEEIETSEAKPQLSHLLHRFDAYLSTLFSQVNMRAVLMDHPFDPESA